jgi:hypothetical protein
MVSGFCVLVAGDSVQSFLCAFAYDAIQCFSVRRDRREVGPEVVSRALITRPALLP